MKIGKHVMNLLFTNQLQATWRKMSRSIQKIAKHFHDKLLQLTSFPLTCNNLLASLNKTRHSWKKNSWLCKEKGCRGWGKIICTNIFNCSASNTHSARLGHAKKLFIRKFPLKWGIVRFCRSYITRDMGQNVFSRFYEFFKNLRKKIVSKNQTDVFSSGV